GRKVLTGSGPASWSHDGTPEGVYDLNGNVWEWVSGLRLAEGTIQVIPGNDVALQPDQSSTSEEWTAIASDGYSVKYAEVDDEIQLTVGIAGGYGGCLFSELTTDAEVPFLVQALALFPTDDDPLTDGFWMDAEESERLPIRGGSWSYGSLAGGFALTLNNARSDSASYIGFRSAFVPGI
ncbi:transcriptional regulator, partial [Paenibacillus popilliae ATCC 14706]